MIDINKNYLANWYANKARRTALDFLGKKCIDDVKSKEELNLIYRMMISNLSRKLAGKHIDMIGE